MMYGGAGGYGEGVMGGGGFGIGGGGMGLMGGMLMGEAIADDRRRDMYGRPIVVEERRFGGFGDHHRL